MGIMSPNETDGWWDDCLIKNRDKKIKELESENSILHKALEIGTCDNPDFGDYSKTAINFHDAWSKLFDENRILREALEKIDYIGKKVRVIISVIDED